MVFGHSNHLTVVIGSFIITQAAVRAHKQHTGLLTSFSWLASAGGVALQQNKTKPAPCIAVSHTCNHDKRQGQQSGMGGRNSARGANVSEILLGEWVSTWGAEIGSLHSEWCMKGIINDEQQDGRTMIVVWRGTHHRRLSDSSTTAAVISIQPCTDHQAQFGSTTSHQRTTRRWGHPHDTHGWLSTS